MIDSAWLTAAQARLEHGLPLRALDLFCREGGATKGYQRAGFTVTGVDKLNVSVRYVGEQFVQGDALEFLSKFGRHFDFIHASPPCQGYTIGNAANPHIQHDRLIAATRDLLVWNERMFGVPWVIENVQQARKEMIDPILLCGRMFGLEALDEDGERLLLDRHRLFEASFPIEQPEHVKHRRGFGPQVAGVYGGGRTRKPGMTAAEHREDCRVNRNGGYVPASVEVQQELLGIDWMTQAGMKESIPPAYSQFIGEQFIKHIKESNHG